MPRLFSKVSLRSMPTIPDALALPVLLLIALAAWVATFLAGQASQR